MRRWRYGLLAVAVGLVACSAEPSAEPMHNAAPVEVQATAVRRGEIAVSLQFSGETQAFDVLRLGSPVAGRVSALEVRPGDAVTKGQVVARVLPLESEAAVNGFGVLEQAGKLRGNDLRLAQRLAAEIRRHDIALRAPFGAVVSARLRNPGERVAANDILLELFDPRSLYVVAQAPIDAAASLRAGAPAEITLGDQILAGRVDAVLNAVTPQALTVPVRVVLTGRLSHPLLGAAVRCRVMSAVHRDVLLIPPPALLAPTAGSSAHVFVVSGDRAARRIVRVGLETPDAVEILAGLSEGEMVLIGGQYALPDAAPIVVRPM